MKKIGLILLMTAAIFAVMLLSGCSTDTASGIITAPFDLPANLAELQSQATEALEFEEFGDGYAITRYYGKGEYEVWLPDEYNGKPVVRIDDKVFIRNKNLLSVYIPPSVTIVGNNCFEGCTNLHTVYISEGVDIGGALFVGCEKLTTVYWPSSIDRIPLFTFMGCGFENIVIPSHIKKLGNNCFYECENLKSVVLPRGITVVPINAFTYCTSLTEVSLPNSIDEICHNAFEGCTALTSIKLPRKLIVIESDAFKDCTSLTVVNIPQKVTTISLDTFEGCQLTVYAPHEEFYYLGFPEEYLEEYTEKYKEWLAEQGSPKRYVESEDEYCYELFQDFIENGYDGVTEWIVI